MSKYLVLSALNDGHPEPFGDLVKTVLDCKCSIVESRVTALGQQYGALMLLSGNWNALAKLEMQLEKLAAPADGGGGLRVTTRRTEARAVRDDALPYAVEVVALDEPGILYRLVDFFAARTVQVDDLISRSFNAPHTGALMCTVNLVLAIPAEVHIAVLREEFMDFCDQFNWDAVLEPAKT